MSPTHAIKPGEYIVEDLNAVQIMALAGDGSMKPLDSWPTFDETQDWNGRSVLLVRAGGFGDLILLTPVTREIKRRWPNCHIGVACMKDYSSVLSQLPHVNEIVEYPIPTKVAEKFDAWVFFEKAIEKNPLAKTMHMTDLFARITGLTGIEGLAGAGGHPALDDSLADYRVTQNEIIWVLEQYPRNPEKRRLCIQVGTSGLCRMYPLPQFELVVKEMLRRGWEVFMMGAKGEVNVPEFPGLFNLAAVSTTFRQSCAVLNNADCFLGNDSALLHIAGALKIPAVGLYGPFLADLRTRYAETTFAIQGKGECAPCFHHANAARRNHFPDNCPSKAQGICQVLASIEPKRIVAKIEQIAKPLGFAGL